MNKKLIKVSLLMLGAFYGIAEAASCSTSSSSCSTSPSCNTSCDTSCDSNSVSCQGDVAGTFLFIRPNFQVGMPEVESLWRRRANNGECGEGRECGIGGAIQIVPFGGRSTKSARLGSFFLFGGDVNSATVGSSQALSATTAPAQINPVNFGVDYFGTGAGYSSTITFNPHQSFAGVGFEWRQYLGWWNECDSQWWFDISFPFEQVQNKMNLCEIVTSSGGTLRTGAAANMVEAFAGLGVYTNVTGAGNAVSMQFGLIPLSSNCSTSTVNNCSSGCDDDCSTSVSSCSSSCSTVSTCSSTSNSTRRNGIADVTIRLGYDALCTECCYVNGYVGVLAPTGNRPTARLMFEPIIGHNRHVGFVFGSLMSYDIWKDCDRALSWEVNFDSLYLFKGKETRSFDLNGHGDLSRYLLVYASAADAAAGLVSPGINYFTQQVNVTPRFWASINSALVYNQQCGLAAELGWNFWAKQAEEVSLSNASCFTGVSLVALGLSNTQYDPAASNLLNSIGNNNSCQDVDGLPCLSSSAALATDLVLTASDLNLCSGANPAAMTNTLYGTVGYNFDWRVPMFVGVGGSYEFTPINTALNRWTVWGKFGVSF